MNAQDTFLELQEFWRKAYSLLDVKNPDIKSTLEKWVSEVLIADGLSPESSVYDLFSFKPPEPFFGGWTADSGDLSVSGKTIVALINPGDGITYNQCADSKISVVGRSHLQLLKEFYTTGSIKYSGKFYRLIYSRKLRNPEYNYRSGTKQFAWGWWSGQWENMLRAINETDEDDSFLTLELFAYSSEKATKLNSNIVDKLHSSQLVIRLIANLIQDESARPKRIVLVNKRKIWEPWLHEYGYKLVPMKQKNKADEPKAFRVYFNEQPTEVPVILLEKAQKMKFPKPDNGAREIFGWN